jgi:uncharacterized membrane protein YcaP (DUF421 family)
MDAVVRAATIYFFLLIMFRLAGKRAFAQLTSFDFVLLLIIAEATQQGLIGNDFSLTQAFMLILTLVALDIAMSLLKQYLPRLDRLVEGMPLVIVDNGVPLRHLMAKARVDEKDVLTAARERLGLERMDQIKFAVLERSGGISIIPVRQG